MRCKPDATDMAKAPWRKERRPVKTGQERWTRTKPLLRAPRVFSDWAPPGILQRVEKESNSQCVVFFQSAGKGPLQTDGPLRQDKTNIHVVNQTLLPAIKEYYCIGIFLASASVF